MKFIKGYLFIGVFIIMANGFGQSRQFYPGIFNDKIVPEVLKYYATAVSVPYQLISKTDKWSRTRFFIEPSSSFQHSEAMNLYAFNDSVVKKLITPKQWSMLAHMALKQYSTRIKHGIPNVLVQPNHKSVTCDTYFSITKPVVYKNIAILDLTYYQPGGGSKSYEAGYRGQAFFIFQRNGTTWSLKRVINSPLL